MPYPAIPAEFSGLELAEHQAIPTVLVIEVDEDVAHEATVLCAAANGEIHDKK